MKVILCDFAQVLLHAKRPNIHKVQEQVKRSGSSLVAFHKLNDELLTFIGTVSNVKKYIFTAGTAHRDPVVSAQIERIFDGVLTTTQVGFSKNNPEAFKQVAELLREPPQNFIFIDDLVVNVRSAQSAGMEAHVFTSNKEIISAIKKWLE